MRDSPFPELIGPVPHLTTEQMIEVDRAMMEDMRIELIQMMENAGRNLADLARQRFLDGDPRGKEIVVLAGSGGNGGGALVCARRLSTWGADVQVYLSRLPDDLAPVPHHQWRILRNMGVPVHEATAPPSNSEPDLIVDGLIGYSLRGAPRDSTAVLIRWANGRSAPVLSLDTPSGLDTSSGEIFEPAIQATATMTLALPKQGLADKSHVGELYLADISVPPQLYASPSLNLEVGPLFARNDVVRLL